jgi:adenine-specific DNA-methyltransferase
MGDFKTKLYELFKEDSRLWDKDKRELNETLLKDLIDKLDEKIIELLLKNEETKEKFFIKIKDVFILKQNELKFFIDENKIDNSYTQYKNKIGLRVGNKLLTERDEVVLDWPFKDCVLEGGMTKEDQKRNEIFFNEILAKDEIDRLFEQKTLINWKRYIAEGEEKVKELKRNDNGTIKENLIIKGNNLLAMHSLKEQFAGKVKLIYIDPPYNTGNDSFGYNDNFNHSAWLTFIKNRLDIAKELLKEDGAILIQCDDTEQAYLKLLMDNIFNRNNFKCDIVVMMGSESGVNAINVMRGERLFKVKEHILYYVKNVNMHRFKPLYIKAMDYNMNYILEVQHNSNGYSVANVYKKMLNEMYDVESINGLSFDEKQLLLIKTKKYCLEKADKIFALKKDIQKSGDKFKEFASENIKKGIVQEFITSDGRKNLVYQGGMLSPLASKIVSENGKKYYGKLISDFWWDIGATPSKEGNVQLKSGKKPEKLIKRIIELITDPGEIVLDFFLGSGTTCAVAHKMGRQYIGIEQLDYEDNDSVKRLQNVIKGDQSGISKSVDWQGGGDFIYCELAKWNEKAKEKILQSKSLNELVKLFDELYERYFLNYDVKTRELKEKIIKEKDFINLRLDEQKRLFIEMLDMNQMYVNFSERNDEKYKISPEDIGLSEDFYNVNK